VPYEYDGTVEIVGSVRDDLRVDVETARGIDPDLAAR
jgi:hypothetical protein